MKTIKPWLKCSRAPQFGIPCQIGKNACPLVCEARFYFHFLQGLKNWPLSSGWYFHLTKLSFFLRHESSWIYRPTYDCLSCWVSNGCNLPLAGDLRKRAWNLVLVRFPDLEIGNWVVEISARGFSQKARATMLRPTFYCHIEWQGLSNIFHFLFMFSFSRIGEPI